jgi:hypothetical protein
MYVAFRVRSCRSNTRSPCTSSISRRGGDWSSSTVCPAGMTTKSSATGGSWLSHVVNADHRSRYRNSGVEDAGSTARPRPATVSENDVGGMSGGGGRAPVVHVTAPAVTVCTAQGTPFTTTVTLSTTEPKPAPVMVSRVPPRELPRPQHSAAQRSTAQHSATQHNSQHRTTKHTELYRTARSSRSTMLPRVSRLHVSVYHTSATMRGHEAFSGFDGLPHLPTEG